MKFYILNTQAKILYFYRAPVFRGEVTRRVCFWLTKRGGNTLSWDKYLSAGLCIPL